MTDLIANGESGASVRAKLNALLVNTVSVNINQAQFWALGDSPPILLPAPGVGKANIVQYCFIQFIAGSDVYDSDIGGNVGIGYASGPLASTTPSICATNAGLNSDQVGFWHASVNSVSFTNLPSIPFSDIENIAIVLVGHSQVAGPIVTSTLGAGGSGYVIGDTGLLPNNSGDATYVVDSISGGGGTGPVATYHLSSVGTGYPVQNGASTQVSTGAGDGAFTINLTSVRKGNGTAKVTVGYQIITLP